MERKLKTKDGVGFEVLREENKRKVEGEGEGEEVWLGY